MMNVLINFEEIASDRNWIETGKIISPNIKQREK